MSRPSCVQCWRFPRPRCDNDQWWQLIARFNDPQERQMNWKHQSPFGVKGEKAVDVMKSSEWFQTVCTKTEEELLMLIKENKELMTMEFHFSCKTKYNIDKLHDVCECGVALEMLQSEKPIEKMIKELSGYLDNGYCPHIPITEVKTEDLNIMQEEATTYLMHIAVALGKKKVVNYILSKLICPHSELYKFYATKILLLTPLHLALINNDIGLFELISKRCRWFHGLRSNYYRSSPCTKIHYEKCITIAAGCNNLPFLEVSVRNYESHHNFNSKYTSMIDFWESFCKALKMHSYDSAKILAKEVGKLYTRNCSSYRKSSIYYEYPTSYMDIPDAVFTEEDERNFNILSSVKNLDMSYCLQRLISFDNVKYMPMILKKGKEWKVEIPFLIQVVLKNQSMEMANLLLAYCKEDARRCYKGYTALDWAKVLGYIELEKLISSKGVGSNMVCVQLYPPLLAVFDFENVGIDLLTSVKRLVVRKHDLNAESDNGITPFIRATCVKGDNQYPIIQTLLLNGSDPFKGITSSGYPDYLRKCLKIFLYCNIDMFKQNFEVSVFRHILLNRRTTCTLDDLELILKHAHTIPKEYKKALLFQYGSSNLDEDSFRHIVDDFFHNPKSLLILCRNSIRHHYGTNIHVLVTSFHLPLKMKEILTLEHELNQ